MHLRKQYSLIWAVFLCLMGAAVGMSCTGGGGGKGTGKTGRLAVKGLLKVPAKNTKAALTVKRTVVESFSKIQESASQGTCDLLDANFKVVATGQTAEDGSFSFLIDDSSLVDSTHDRSGGQLTYHIRCSSDASGGKAVQMATVSTSKETAESGTASGGGLASISTNIDTEHTAETLLVYQGRGLNPLSAGEDKAPPPITGFSNLVQAVGNAVSAVSGNVTVKKGSNPADTSIGTLQKALAALNTGGALSDGTSSLDAINLLFNADKKSSTSALNAVADALQGDSELLGTTTKDILGNSKSATDFKGALDVLAKNAAFEGLDDKTERVLVGALANHPSEEVEAMLSTDNFLKTVLNAAKSVKIDDGATDADIEKLANSLGVFLTPAIVASVTNDPKALAAVLAAVSNLIDAGKGDSAAAEFLARGFENAKSSFWAGLVDGNGNATSGVANIVAFVEETVDQYDTDPSSDKKVTDAIGVLSSLDPNKDYASESSAALDAEAKALAEKQIIAFDPLSCKKADGTNFCVDSDSNLQCGCDAGCDVRGDCCQDKADTCGAKPLTDFLTQTGQDPQTSNFSDDGSAAIQTPSLSSVSLGESDAKDSFAVLAAGAPVSLDTTSETQVLKFQVLNSPTVSQASRTCVMCSGDNSTFHEWSCADGVDDSPPVKSSSAADDHNFRSNCFVDPADSTSLVHFRVDYNDSDGKLATKTEATNLNITIDQP